MVGISFNIWEELLKNQFRPENITAKLSFGKPVGMRKKIKSHNTLRAGLDLLSVVLFHTRK